jgi:photosystem II stability/assembly factor-like uncharacterized protein
LLRTRNRGGSWERLGGGLPGAGADPTADDVRRVYLSPAFATDGALLALMADGGLFLSHDRGDGWTRLTVGRTFAAAFARAFATNGVIYAAVLAGEPATLALARSTDCGATWSVVQPLALAPVAGSPARAAA